MIKSFPAENKGWSRSGLSLLEKKKLWYVWFLRLCLHKKRKRAANQILNSLLWIHWTVTCTNLACIGHLTGTALRSWPTVTGWCLEYFRAAAHEKVKGFKSKHKPDNGTVQLGASSPVRRSSPLWGQTRTQRAAAPAELQIPGIAEKSKQF